MSKKIGIIILIVIMVAMVGLTLNHIDKIQLDYEMSRIQAEVLKNKDLEECKQVFISISDGKQKAIVRNASGNSLSEAMQKAKQKIMQEEIEPKYIKVDIVKEEQEIAASDLYSYIYDVEKFCFRRGISFSKNYEVALLEAELNSNKIIDYSTNDIDYDNLREYLSTSNKGMLTLEEEPEQLILFQCVSYFYDAGNIYSTYTTGNGYGRRMTDGLEKDEIESNLKNATNYLKNNVKEDGSFVYNYYPIEQVEEEDYNILRHEGTTWSMIQTYSLTKEEKLKQKIDLDIQYVVENAVKEKDENTAFILEEKDNELKLGANGIGLLMLVEYMQTFQTNAYEEIAIKLANGILEMQNENGSYYHVYEYPTFKEKQEYRTTYYDGEATFALLKLYEYTKDEKYLQAAQKSMNYFVENEYEQYRDQWVQYSVNEITTYLPNEEYFELGLRNMTQNYNEMLDDLYGSPTNLELLATGLEIYYRAVESGIDVSYFDKDKLVSMIEQVSEKQLNGFFYPEYAMYFNEPSRILYAFFKRTTNFRIRIDDVQHHINAYYTILKNYSKIYPE